MVWYDNAWLNRIKITIDETKIPGTNSLPNFPVYVDLSNLPQGFWDVVDPQGDDIVVTGSDGTAKLSRELVFLDTTNKVGELHFNSSGLPANSDTDFYIYFNNNSAAETNTNATWEANYKGIWHFHSGLTDSTQFGKNWAASDTINHVAGKLAGSSAYFINTNSFARIQEGSSGTNTLIHSTGPFAISCWIKTSGGNTGGIIQRANSILPPNGVAYFWDVKSTTQVRYSQNTPDISANFSAADNAWHYHAVSKKDTNAGGQYLIGDGSVIGSITNTSDQSETGSIFLGDLDGNRLNGYIDEFRWYKNTGLGSEYFIATFENQNSPSTFYTVGAVESNAADSVFQYTNGFVTICTPMVV